MTRALVIGYGSIGQRHARLLAALGCEVSVVSRREVDHERSFASVAGAVRSARPDYAVVANETSSHLSTVEDLRVAGFEGPLLIEKPLGDGDLPPSGAFARVALAYNLRFHPMLAALRDELADQRIIAMEVYCGQFLPDWRPARDYRSGYSADCSRGGGVLRDLSHELDYLLWLTGPWRRTTALGGQLSDLDIRSDDCWGMLIELERCPVATLQINYLDRPGRRRITVNAADHTYCADFGTATLVRDGVARNFTVERDATYLAQHRAMLSGDVSSLCDLAEGEQVMRLISAAERARDAQTWVAA